MLLSLQLHQVRLIPTSDTPFKIELMETIGLLVLMLTQALLVFQVY